MHLRMELENMFLMQAGFPTSTHLIANTFPFYSISLLKLFAGMNNSRAATYLN